MDPAIRPSLADCISDTTSRLETNEDGQTSSEYVAITAVAVAIGIGVVYASLSGALMSAISIIGSRVVSFVNGAFV